MKNQITLSLLFIALTTQLVTAQDTDITYGIKAGADNFTYTEKEITDKLNTKFGFYVGGFANFNINDVFKIQPELLYARHRRDEVLQNVKTVYNNIPGQYLGGFYFEITESIIQMPIMGQYYFTDEFYSEFGPQFGYTFDKKLAFSDKSSGHHMDGETITTKLKYDAFDFGLSVGLGYNINKHIGVSTRYYLGLIKRDNQANSSVLYFGLQYKV